MTTRRLAFTLTLLGALLTFGVFGTSEWNTWWNQAGGQKDRSSRSSWLQGTMDERFHQVEQQLRGFDRTMVEVGYRFTELYFAGQDRNWDYAKYQLEKLETALHLGFERRPKRAASAQSFLTASLPTMREVVEKADSELFQAEIERLRSACMYCHVLEEVPYFTVELPERRLSPIRTSRDARSADD
jgi:hypothetical protein